MPPPSETAVVSEGDRGAWLEGIIFGGMIAILVWGPLAFGTTQEWSQFIQRTFVLALFGVWVTRQHLRGLVELSENPIYPPTVLFGAYAGIQLLAATVYRYPTLQELLNLSVYGVLILIAGETLNRRLQLRTFVLGLAWFGFAVSIFAIFQALSNTREIYWFQKTTEISAAIFGPYANHNHYAGLMEMLIPLAVAAAFIESGAKRVLLAFASAMMALSVVFSRSRGGILGMAVSLIFVCVVLFRTNRSKRGLLGVLSLVAVVVAFSLWLSPDRVLQRFSEAQDGHRVAIYADSLRMWTHHPVLGTGLGTFPNVYPSYKSFFGDTFVNYAHNDYLQLLVEMGALGFAIAMWFLIVVFRQGFRKISKPRAREERILTLAAMTAIVALLSHSLLDFNLHIPANAALFYVLCSAVATPFKHRVQPIEIVPDDSPLDDSDDLDVQYDLNLRPE
jgi:O-antigen ligase